MNDKKYTLITVTYGGEVNHSRGYETLYMCEQAKSLALTGMTIEQNKKADEDYEKFQNQMTQSGGCSPCYFPNEGEAVEWVRGRFLKKHKHDVKHAECIIEP